MPRGVDEWADEVVLRTSAPARRPPTLVRASDPTILNDSFLYWSDKVAVEPVDEREIKTLRKFIALGGLLVIDDASATSAGKDGPFGISARRELARILPSSVVVPLKPDHVLFRTYYLLSASKRDNSIVKDVDAVMQGTAASVILLHSNLVSQLAEGVSASISDDGTRREMAIRFAVNIAMYSLCSNYKDDQVHGAYLMRHRGRTTLP